jgi:hypothetical protein
MLMTATTSPVRHAIARSTGATTWTRKDGDTWRSTCLNHGDETTAPNQGKAWVTGSHPQDFCAKCKAIAAGKAEKITGPRLDLPTAKKAAAKKATAKPAATKATK